MKIIATGTNFNSSVLMILLGLFLSQPGAAQMIMLDQNQIEKWPKILEENKCNTFLAYTPSFGLTLFFVS